MEYRGLGRKIAYFALAVLLGYGVQALMRELRDQDAQTDDLSTTLFRVSSELNQNLPMRLDQYTELMNTVGFGSTLTYNVRLVDVVRGDVSPAELVSLLRNEVQPNTVSYVCSTPETLEVLDAGVTLEYVYHYHDMEHIDSLEVRKRDC